MSRPIAKLKVVQSSQADGCLSLRGPKGRGRRDPPQPHITSAGFRDGDDVALIRAQDLETLLALEATVRRTPEALLERRPVHYDDAADALACGCPKEKH